MTGTKLAATAVLLLLFWNTHQAHAQGLNNHPDHTEKRVVWEYRLAIKDRPDRKWRNIKNS